MMKIMRSVHSLLAAVSLCLPVYGAVVDRIVVVVKNEVITQNEIDRTLAPLYGQIRNSYPDEKMMKRLEEARQSVITQLINEKLIVGEAKKLNVEVSEKEIDARIAEAQRRFASKEMFEQAIAAQRLSVKELRVMFKEQIMAKKLVDGKIGSGVTITPGEVKSYYEKHTSEFVQPEEVKARNILIKINPGVNEQKATELAMDIDKRLKDGGDFSELAKLYSEGPGSADGGAMGFVRRGDMMPEIENVIFGLKEGETSSVLQTSVGYHFFKVDEKRPAKTLSLSEARSLIEDAIFREKANDKMEAWVKSLKKTAYIAFK